MLIVHDIRGPGINSEGSLAVFVNFSGCNMWSGHPDTKAKSQCPFCDTDFVSGKKMYPRDVVEEVEGLTKHRPMLVVVSGGEPLLQKQGMLLEMLVRLHELGYETQLETNGTFDKPPVLRAFDYVTCSPKVPISQCAISWQYVTSIKLLFPHPNRALTPHAIDQFLSTNRLTHIEKYLKPIDTSFVNHNVFHANSAIQEIKDLNSDWRLAR